MNRWGMKTVVVCATATALAGCSIGGGKKDADGLQKLGDEPITIKVMSNYDESYFYQQYGQLFIAKYPNIDLEVIPLQGAIEYGPDKDMAEQYKKFIEEKQPDVLVLHNDILTKLAEQGMLYELDQVIAQDKFDIENMLPSVIASIRALGNGKLYGLATGFTSQAVYYNKTLFDQHGVPYPTDQMTWEQLLETAQRFPTTGSEDSRIYGLGFNTYQFSLFQIIAQMGMSKGLNYVDATSKQVTMDTEGWRQVGDLAVKAAKSGALFKPDPEKQFRGGSIEDYYKSDPFIGGKTAMIINHNYLMGNLKEAKNYMKEAMPEWDLVSVPVDPQNPEAGGTVSPGEMFAVRAQSPQVRAAWEFVKYVSGDEFARVTSKSSGARGMMPIRTKYIEDKEGRNMKAFYANPGQPNELYRSMENLPPTFGMKFMSMADEKFKAVEAGTLSMEEALKQIQTEGQEVMIQAENEKPAEGEGAPSSGGMIITEISG